MIATYVTGFIKGYKRVAERDVDYQKIPALEDIKLPHNTNFYRAMKHLKEKGCKEYMVQHIQMTSRYYITWYYGK